MLSSNSSGGKFCDYITSNFHSFLQKLILKMPGAVHCEKHQKYGGGPHGLGDPNDLSLRKVEEEILIPKKIREKAKELHCAEEVKQFTECCASSNILMVYKCREQNNKLKSCLTLWYDNEDFKKLCKDEYLRERAEYRRTGIRANQKRLGASM